MPIAEKYKKPESANGKILWLVRGGCLLLLVWATFFYYRGFQTNTIDDAGISFQYARNFAQGHGFRYHPDFEPVEGFSNPLWTLIMAAGFRIGFTDLIFLAKFLGSLCWFLSGLIFIFAFSKPPGIIFFTLLFLSPQNAYWANSGLENASVQLIISGLLVFYRYSRIYSVLLFLLIFSRPEGIIYALVALFFSRRKFFDLRLIVGVAVFLTVFRLIYFHDFLPNTFYAKRGWLHSADPVYNLSYGFEYWLSYFRNLWGFAWFGPLLLLYALYRRQWLPFFLFMAHLFFLCFVGGDWMQYFRFMSFIFPLFVALLAEFMTNICRLRSEITAFFLVFLLNAAFLRGQYWRDEYRHLQKPYLSLEARIERGRYFEKLALELGIRNPSLLDPDVGGTAYGTEMRILDLVGLTNRELGKSARNPEDFRSFIMYYKPDFIYSAGVWNHKTHLFELPELFRDYIPVSGSVYVDPVTTQAWLIRRVYEKALRDLERKDLYE